MGVVHVTLDSNTLVHCIGLSLNMTTVAMSVAKKVPLQDGGVLRDYKYSQEISQMVRFAFVAMKSCFDESAYTPDVRLRRDTRA